MFVFLPSVLCIQVVRLILKSSNLISVIVLTEIIHQFVQLSCKWGTYFVCAFCHEGLFYFVTFLSQNFLFLFSGGEFVAVRSFWAF